MEGVVELLSPDGWICAIVQSGARAFSPVAWKPSDAQRIGEFIAMASDLKDPHRFTEGPFLHDRR